MKNKLVLALILIVGLVVFCAVRDFIIKNVVVGVVSNVTGAPTRIGGFSLSIIKQTVSIADLKMYNPKGFPEDVLVDMPKIAVSYDLGALLKGKLHLKQLDIDLKEIGLAKNKQGKLNVDSLKIVEEQKKNKGNKKSDKVIAIQIDLVSLSMGRVVNKDYSVEGPAVIKVYEINLKKTYKNITSVQQLSALIMAEPLKAAGIQGAKIYGVMMLTGVAALPVAVVFTLAGKDYAQANFDLSWDRAYDLGMKQLQNSGKIKNGDRKKGIIHAEVNGAGVALQLKKITDLKTQITVSARKFGLPQPEISSGILYRISQELK